MMFRREMKKIIMLLLVVLLGGCATITSKLTPAEWSGDAVLQKSSVTLAEDYLKDQATGGANAQSFFAPSTWGGVQNFLNLHEWKITSTGLFDSLPGVYCRLKVENAMGGVGWATYGILMDYDKSLRDKGDKYNGLRIFAVMETSK